MERIRIGMVAMAVVLAAGLAQAQDKPFDSGLPALAQDKKKPAETPAGPYGLPLLTAVKEKVKLTAEQEPKLTEIYAGAGKNEEETKKRAKENQTERKDLEKYLAEGRSDAINKIRAVLDDAQKKTFDGMLAPAQPKKKNN